MIVVAICKRVYAVSIPRDILEVLFSVCKPPQELGKYFKFAQDTIDGIDDDDT